MILKPFKLFALMAATTGALALDAQRHLDNHIPDPILLGNIRPEGIRLLPTEAANDLGLVPNNSTYAIVSELFYGGVLLVNLDTGNVTQLVQSLAFGSRAGIGIHYAQGHIFMAGGGPALGFASASVTVFDPTQADPVVVTCSSDQGGFFNEVAIVGNVAYITDSLVNQLWALNIPEAIAGNCVLSSIPLPADEFAVEGEFMSNGIVPYGNGVLIGTTFVGALHFVDPDTGNVTEVLPPSSINFVDGMETHTEDNGKVLLYITENLGNVISVWELTESDTSDAPIAEKVGFLTSADFDTPTTSAIVGDLIWSVNARFASIGFPAVGEADPSNFTETFDVVAVERSDFVETSAPTMSPVNQTDAPTMPPSSEQSGAVDVSLHVGLFCLTALLSLPI